MGKSLKGKELGRGISQRSDGLYAARYVDKTGKRRQKNFKNLKDCRQWLADDEFADEHRGISSNMLVDDLYEEWIAIKEKTVRVNSVKMYRQRYERNIRNVIGKMVISEVKTIHCQKILNNMADGGYGNSTIKSTKIVVRGLFEFAEENELIEINPCKRSVKHNIGKEKVDRVPLTRDAQKEFLREAAKTKYYLPFAFMLQTGLRFGELAGLTWQNVDLEARTISVTRTISGQGLIGEPKSKAGNRIVPLTGEAIDILKKQKEKNMSLSVISLKWQDSVFLNTCGSILKNNTTNEVVERICEKAGIPRISVHVLRHTFATRCIEAGVKPKTLQAILGHSNIYTTMDLYVHMTEDEKQKEIDSFSEALKVV